MARRNSVADFVRSFNLAYDTLNNVGRDFELARVGREEEKPIELQGPNPDGSAQGATGQVEFLGKTYDKPLSDDQKASARAAAQAGVYDRFGDPERANALRRQQQQGKLTDLQIGQAERQAKRDKQTDDDEAKVRAVDDETAAWFESRLKNPDGSMRPPTADDHLEASQYRVAKLVGAGQIKAANALAKDNMQMASQKIQLQKAERDEALARVSAQVAAGDLSSLPEFYQRFIPDGAKVTNITQDPKTGAIKVERESVDGRTLAPTTFKDRNEVLAGLKSFQDPMALYNYSVNEFSRGLQERQVKNQERQIGNQERRLDQAETERKDARSAAVEYFKKQNPNASPEEVEAVRTGVLSVTPKDDHRPAEVKLADALLKSGMAPDMKSALEMSLTKKAMSPQERFFELSKPQGGIAPDPSAVAKVMSEVYGENWKSKIKAERPAAPAGPKKGDRQTIQSGPNAGKTAEYDGQGWVLAP